MKWELKTIDIKSIKENPKNPRQIDKTKFKNLSSLIEKFGLIDKPILNADLTLIGGHQRVRVLKKKKTKSVECWVCEVQLCDADIDELCIGLNLHQGSFDYDILANEYDALDLLKYGFTEEQILGSCEEQDCDSEEKEKTSSKKTKCCPNCGHEF